MKAFSLVEVMVALLIGMLVLLGALYTSSTVNGMARHYQEQTQVKMALKGVMTQLQLDLSGIDTQFWQAFPFETNVVHKIDHSHRAYQFTRDCPNGIGACLIYADLKPIGTDATVYTATSVDDDAGLTYELLPYGLGRPPGLVGIESMSVLLVGNANGVLPCLVVSSENDVVQIAARPAQPWNQEPDGSMPLEAVHLGRLEIHHRFLESRDVQGHVLVDERWTFDSKWRVAEIRRGKAMVANLNWEPCTSQFPDRFTLAAQHPRGRQEHGRPPRRFSAHDTLYL